MSAIGDRAVMTEQSLDINGALGHVLEIALQSDEALCELLTRASADAGAGQRVLVGGYVQTGEMRQKFFRRQVAMHHGALLRPGLLSLRRISAQERVEIAQEAARLASEDLRCLQEVEIEGITSLSEQIVGRHLQLLASARDILRQPGVQRLGGGTLKSVAEAIHDEWRSDGG